MREWKKTTVGKFIYFNPSEKLSKGEVAKKVPMENLTANERKITGYELAPYNGGAKFRNGDTLLAKITPCLENGKTAQVDILEEGEVGFGSTEFIVLRENEHSINDFIFYLAKSPAFRKKAISCMEGTSGRKRVSDSALKLQEITVPDNLTQKQIAAVLSAIDTKIDLNNRINAELEAMAKTVYDYWFVQFDFPDATGNPYKSSGGKMVWNEEVKREIPDGWKVGTIADLGRIITGGTPSTEKPEYFTQEGIPWITPKDLSNTSDKYISRGATDITPTGLANSSAKLIPANSVLLTARAPIGYLAVSLNEVCTNQGFKSIVPHAKFGTEYVFQTLKSMVPRFQVLGAKSTFKEISKEVFAAVPIPLPLGEIANKFKAIIEPFSAMRKNAENESQQLTALRDWLLPMLMNGQVQVAAQSKTIERPEPAISIAAEPEVAYGTRSIPLPIPPGKEAFAKRVLGGRVVSLFKDDLHFTHIKFQKVQYLADMLSGASLGTSYYIQAAGPYDNTFMHTVANNLKASDWFEERNFKWHPLAKHEKIEGYYNSYFAPALQTLDNLFSLLADKTEEESEIIATLYAVWNNRIILHQPISDEALITDFYNWSERKQQYLDWPLVDMLTWMRQHGIVPVGAGKELKRAAGTKKKKGWVISSPACIKTKPLPSE